MSLDLPTLGFYGVLHLSKELENPYGWDFNDIDLNSFQKSLHEDMMTIHACAFGEVRPRPRKETHILPRTCGGVHLHV